MNNWKPPLECVMKNSFRTKTISRLGTKFVVSGVDKISKSPISYVVHFNRNGRRSMFYRAQFFSCPRISYGIRTPSSAPFPEPAPHLTVIYFSLIYAECKKKKTGGRQVGCART